jgi:hypothetical protein
MLQMHIHQCFITDPRIHGSDPRASPGGAPPHVRTVPTPFAYADDPCLTALARCAHAARSTARILQGLLAHVSSPAVAWVELRDLSAVITGACMTGTVLQAVNAAKRRVRHTSIAHLPGRASDVPLSSGKSEDGEIGTAPGDITTNEELFDVCIDVLKLVQDR